MRFLRWFASLAMIQRRHPSTLRRFGLAAIRISPPETIDRKSTRLNSSHQIISYAVFCLKKKNHSASSGEPGIRAFSDATPTAQTLTDHLHPRRIHVAVLGSTHLSPVGRFHIWCTPTFAR